MNTKKNDARVSPETNQTEASGTIRFAPQIQKTTGIIDADSLQAARNEIRPTPCADIIEAS